MITLNRLREMKAQKGAGAVAAAMDAEEAEKYKVYESREEFRNRIVEAVKKTFGDYAENIDYRRFYAGETTVTVYMKLSNVPETHAKQLKDKAEVVLAEFMPESLVKSADFKDVRCDECCALPEADCCCDSSYSTFHFEKFDKGAVSYRKTTANKDDSNDYTIEIRATTPSLYAASYLDIKANNAEMKKYLDRFSAAAVAPNTHLERIDPTERYHGSLKIVEGKFDDKEYEQVAAMQLLTDTYARYWKNKVCEILVRGEYERIKAAFEGKDAVAKNPEE